MNGGEPAEGGGWPSKAYSEAWRAFGLGEPTRVTPLDSGHQSDNLRVDAIRGSYVLKSMRDSVERVSSIMALQAHLCAQGLPAPAPERTRDGKLAARVGQRTFSVAALLPGGPLPEAEITAQLPVLGAALGRLHRALRAANADSVPELDLAALGPSAVELTLGDWGETLPPRDTDARALHRAFSDRYRAAPSSSLTHSVLHGDIGAFAMFFRDGSLTGLLDFGAAQHGPLLYDVGSFVMYHQLWQPNARPSYLRFVDGYLETAPIGVDELLHLHLWVHARFTVQLAYFAMRLAHGEHQGVASDAENMAGFEDARRMLRTLAATDPQHFVP